VLQDVSFRAPAGKLTALVAPSGAGKTTITHLVPRLYDPVSGTVRIDGHDVRDLTLASLRATVGVVPQDAHLFHDTIRVNLLYARPAATEAELIAACEAAQVWDLISSLPGGLDTVAGDRGYRLSGGEKQRVALARLLLKAPTVVILDEATAHLDSESELAVQRALKTALAGRTSPDGSTTDELLAACHLSGPSGRVARSSAYISTPPCSWHTAFSIPVNPRGSAIRGWLWRSADAPPAAAELAEDAPVLELGVRALAGRAQPGVRLVGLLLGIPACSVPCTGAWRRCCPGSPYPPG
jgi:ABC-type lipoprotein export system ATPase subunit